MANTVPQPHGAVPDAPNMYGQNVAYGIVFLTSNHRNPNFTKITQQTTGIIRKKILGFPAPKFFNSPIHKTKSESISKDLRRPLYWKPDIITNNQGIAEFDFYTSDEKGKYQVTLEGIGINGQVTREVAFFTVK